MPFVLITELDVYTYLCYQLDEYRYVRIIGILCLYTVHPKIDTHEFCVDIAGIYCSLSLFSFTIIVNYKFCLFVCYPCTCVVFCIL